MGFIRNAGMLFIGFLVLRMLGQGSLSLVSTNVINQWWVRRRGMAMGIAGMTAALIGTGGFPNLILRYILDTQVKDTIQSLYTVNPLYR